MLELYKKRELLSIYEDYSFSLVNKPVFFTLNSIYNYISINLINNDYVEARFKVDAHYLEKPTSASSFPSAFSRDNTLTAFGFSRASLIEELPSIYDYTTNTHTKTLKCSF